MADDDSGFNYNWLWLLFAVLLLAGWCGTQEERYCEFVDDGYGGRYLCEP